MPSNAYIELQANVAKLKAEFLNFPQRKDGSAYTDSELYRCLAFIVFSHGEIESFLETIALAALNRAGVNWMGSRLLSRPIVGLMAYSTPKAHSESDPKETIGKSDLDTLFKRAATTHQSQIYRNNGIKPHNIGEMFLPLGICPDEFDETLMIKLGNLGQRRGQIVHKKSKISLPHVRDPIADEEPDIVGLVTDLSDFDALVASL